MKSVLISIRPQWCKKIMSGEKTIEVRKTAPKEAPFKAYIYMTNKKPYVLTFAGNGKMRVHNGTVIGEFICDKVERFSVGSLRSDDIQKLACLSYYEMICYFYEPEELDGKTAKQGFAWHISDLKIYDKPKELGEFGNLCRKDCLRLGKGKSCEFLSTDGTPCNRIIPITRPPQSWQYVEE